MPAPKDPEKRKLWIENIRVASKRQAEKNGGNPKQVEAMRKATVGGKGWSKGLTKETDERIRKHAEFMEGKLTGAKNGNWVKKVTVPCNNCGESLQKTPCALAKTKRFFCNGKCYGNWRSEHTKGEQSSQWVAFILVVCSTCGETILKKPWELKKKGRYFCNLSCYGQWMSKTRRGVNHPLYHKEVAVTTRKKIGKALKGCIPWNKNLTKENDVRVLRMSEENKGRKSWNAGEIGLQIAWNKNLTKETDARVKKYSETLRKTSKKNWQDPEYREKALKALLKAPHAYAKPNKAELKLNSILQKVLPSQYALNVKAEVMLLGGKIPDFVNVDGKKKVIELYGDYYHRKEKLKNGGDGGANRKNTFAKLGFDTLIIWENELKERKTLVRKIKKFNRQENQLQYHLLC